MADCAVNIAPEAEDLAEIALLSAGMVRSLGIEPRVAMLSYSNYGGSEHPLALKVRRAAAIARERAPDLVVDGEIQLFTALDEATRRHYFPYSELLQNANVLIFPDLQSGSLALHLLQKLGDAVAVGPVLTGTRRPFHILQHGKLGGGSGERRRHRRGAGGGDAPARRGSRPVPFAVGRRETAFRSAPRRSGAPAPSSS